MHEPNSDRIDQLLQRIERLEGDLRKSGRRSRRERWLVAGGVTVAFASLLGGLGAASLGPDVIRAKRLEIVDDTNNIILVAGPSANGGRLDLWDSTGQNAVQIGSNRKGGDLSLWNRTGEKVFHAFASTMGGRAEFNGPTGNPVTLISANSRGGMIEIRDTNNQSVVEARCGLAGGELATRRADGSEVSTLSAQPGGGRLSLDSPDEKSFIAIDSSEPGIDATRRGNKAFELAAGNAGGSFVMNDQEGGQRISLDASSAGGLLIMNNDSEQAVVAVGASGASAGLRVRNAQGQTIAALGDDDRDAGVLEISGPAGTTAALLAAEPKGGYFALLGDRENLLMEAGPQEYGGMLRIRDANNRLAAELMGLEDGGGRIGVGDFEEQRRGILEAPASGPVTLNLFTGKTRSLSFGALASGGVLNLLNAGGEMAIFAGVDEQDQAGVVSLRNPTGGEAVRIESDPAGAGEIDVFNADGTKKRTLSGP